MIKLMRIMKTYTNDNAHSTTVSILVQDNSSHHLSIAIDTKLAGDI